MLSTMLYTRPLSDGREVRLIRVQVGSEKTVRLNIYQHENHVTELSRNMHRFIPLFYNKVVHGNCSQIQRQAMEVNDKTIYAVWDPMHRAFITQSDSDGHYQVMSFTMSDLEQLETSIAAYTFYVNLKKVESGDLTPVPADNFFYYRSLMHISRSIFTCTLIHHRSNPDSAVLLTDTFNFIQDELALQLPVPDTSGDHISRAIVDLVAGMVGAWLANKPTPAMDL